MPSVLNVFASLTLTTALWGRYHYYHTILHMGKLKPEKESHFLKVTQLVSWRTGSVHSTPLINLHITFTCNISWNEYSIWHNLVNIGVERTKRGVEKSTWAIFHCRKRHSYNSKDRIPLIRNQVHYVSGQESAFIILTHHESIRNKNTNCQVQLYIFNYICWIV